jgi:SAM-dependent methyltransferase
MHDTAHQSGGLFLRNYWRDGFRSILDVGARDVNGSLRDCAPDGAYYVGVDLEPGPSVDVVNDSAAASLPFADASFDAIVSTSCFEHDQMFWVTFLSMLKTLRPGGYIYISAPSNGPYHSYPYDNWRFYPDSGLALQAWAAKSGFPGTRLIESLTLPRQRGGFNDFVMIFGGPEAAIPEPERLLATAFPTAFNVRRADRTEVDNFQKQTEDARLLNRERRKGRNRVKRPREADTLPGEIAKANETAAAAVAKAAELRGKLTRRNRELRAMKASVSWTLTRPLRAIEKAFSGKTSRPNEDT